MTNFSFEQSVEKKKSEFTQLSHKKNNTPAREEAQNAFLLTRAALTTNTILILIL